LHSNSTDPAQGMSPGRVKARCTTSETGINTKLTLQNT